MQHLGPCLFHTFFFNSFFFLFYPCLIKDFGTHTRIRITSPTLAFCNTLIKKEFILSHALLCFKNKGMDGPNTRLGKDSVG